MDVALLRRRDSELREVPDDAPASHTSAQPSSPEARALEHLDRWIEGGAGPDCESPRNTTVEAQRSLLALPSDRAGKGAVAMVRAELRKEAEEAARLAAGETARKATSKVARLFASGERQALLALSGLHRRTLTQLQDVLPAKVESHIGEHLREMAGKPVHSMFEKGTSMAHINALMTATVRSGARPILSVADNGALVFVLEKEFPKAIGSKGETALRLVVDLEGHVMTAFPFAANEKLATLTVRGVTVAAKIAPLLFLSSLAQSEEEAAATDARMRTATAERSNWLEDALDWFGPYGLFSSSPIAIEPNFEAIKSRTDQAVAEARAAFGRDVTTAEREAIRSCIYRVWVDAMSGVST